MKGIQYSAKEDFKAAKKILYDGNDKTKAPFISILIALVT